MDKECKSCGGTGFIKNHKRTISCNCKKNSSVKTVDYHKCIYCGGLGNIPGCCGTNSIECPVCGEGGCG